MAPAAAPDPPVNLANPSLVQAFPPGGVSSGDGDTVGPFAAEPDPPENLTNPSSLQATHTGGVSPGIGDTEGAAAMIWPRSGNPSPDQPPESPPENLTISSSEQAAYTDGVTLGVVDKESAAAMISKGRDFIIGAAGAGFPADASFSDVTDGEFANVSTVDARFNYGGLTLDLSGNNKSVTFSGGQGNDTYTGSNHGNIITGGLGADNIVLGTTADKLIYNNQAESNATLKDSVSNFDVKADSIQFAVSMQQGAASYIGGNNFTHTGSTQVRFDDITQTLQADLNGDSVADMDITLMGVNAASFGTTNFYFDSD